eukprot:7331440-Lingulodinium_polyedra.AAC.1
MGGTARTVLWDMGYDPIVHATSGPTYVDDLAGNTIGVEQTLRLRFFLLVAWRTAGLSLTTRRCCRFVATA